MSPARLNVVQGRQLTRAARRRQEIRERLWPGVGAQLWHRTSEDGYTSLPRTLPLIMALIDLLKKGKDASRVYLDLWCRQMDDSLVEVTDDASFAFSSGFASGRSVRTWRERIHLLEELGFIETQPRGSRRYGYILLLHPHRVVKRLHEKKLVPPNWWSAYVQSAADYGVKLP